MGRRRKFVGGRKKGKKRRKDGLKEEGSLLEMERK